MPAAVDETERTEKRQNMIKKGKKNKKRGFQHEKGVSTYLRRQMRREGGVELHPRVRSLVRQYGAEGRVRQAAQHQDSRHRSLLPEIHLSRGIAGRCMCLSMSECVCMHVWTCVCVKGFVHACEYITCAHACVNGHMCDSKYECKRTHACVRYIPMTKSTPRGKAKHF